MELTFAPRGILQIDDARICFRNFSGQGDRFNREGDRNFALVIDDQEIADALLNDKNEFGAAWNVHIKDPREEGEAPFMFLKVKVKFNDRGPNIFLKSGRRRKRLTEETVECLDHIRISNIRLDIRPYDGDGSLGPFRSAYLQAMEVVQEVDRFEEEYAEEEFPEE